ncbi:MAG: MBL fold metallo-hydrolase [Lacrimispora sp.]|uniref:MBL fold metallo-hydrolase n=1 Tax=Lacrimispora sp. TaxID=2719234 RepID=UPI0039E66359
MLNAGTRIVNNWIYSIPEGFVLIDTGYENGFARLKKRLSLQRIDIRDIRYVFLTHAHDDHAGFLNELFMESADVQVIMSARAIEGLYRGQNSFAGGCTSRLALFFCYFMKLLGKGGHRFPPLNGEFEKRCILVSDHNREEAGMRLGGSIIDTPGHTADSISLLLGDGSLFCGDAAMNGFPSLHKTAIWAEDKEAFLQSWQTIIGLKPAKIYPGHGNPFDYSELEKNQSYARKMKLYSLKNTE